MSENNNEIVLNEEKKFMNAYKKIPFIPFPSKQKEYVSNYNKNIYRRQKHIAKYVDTEDITYCQYCQYHTTKPRNMRMHLTSSKHHKNIHYTVIRLINNDVIIENGLRVNSLFFNFYLNQLYK